MSVLDMVSGVRSGWRRGVREGDGSARRYMERRARISVHFSIILEQNPWVLYLHGPRRAHPGTYSPKQSYLQLVAAYYSVGPVFSVYHPAIMLLEIPAVTQYFLLFNISILACLLVW